MEIDNGADDDSSYRTAAATGQLREKDIAKVARGARQQLHAAVGDRSSAATRNRAQRRPQFGMADALREGAQARLSELQRHNHVMEEKAKELVDARETTGTDA